MANNNGNIHMKWRTRQQIRNRFCVGKTHAVHVLLAVCTPVKNLFEWCNIYESLFICKINTTPLIQKGSKRFCWSNSGWQLTHRHLMFLKGILDKLHFSKCELETNKGTRMAQWRERSPLTNMAQVRIPKSMPYVGCVCRSFLLVLRGFFAGRVLWFSSSTKKNISKFQFVLETVDEELLRGYPTSNSHLLFYYIPRPLPLWSAVASSVQPQADELTPADLLPRFLLKNHKSHLGEWLLSLLHSSQGLFERLWFLPVEQVSAKSQTIVG